MPCIVESASLEPKFGNKFIAGGEDMWIRVFDFHTGAEIGKFVLFYLYVPFLPISAIFLRSLEFILPFT